MYLKNEKKLYSDKNENIIEIISFFLNTYSVKIKPIIKKKYGY